jgi:hypothetical protein
MRSEELNRQQVAVIEERLLPTLQYLHKLFRQTSHRNFPDDDPLRVAVREAQLSLQKLITELRSCHGGEAPANVNRTSDPQHGHRLGRPKRDTH